MKGKYVQFGCGASAPVEWENYDASPTLILERAPVIRNILRRRVFPAEVRFGDIVRGLPVPESSCEAVYCSHTLEHLTLEEARKALRNTLRILKPGGRFRAVVPDLKILALRYVGANDPDAAYRFQLETDLGKERKPGGVVGRLRSLFGNSAHLWMWDEASLVAETKAAGFLDVRRAHFGDDPDPQFARVENPSRWENCLGISAVRPN
jgi:SAM-dependent methyltransferase